MTSTNHTTPDARFFNPEQILKDINVEDGMHVADFGAGSGYMTFKAAPMVGKKGFIYALDVKKSVIQHLQNEIKHRQLGNTKAIWTDLEMPGRNPVPASSLDLVLVVNTLFQSTKHYAILKEAYRMLKPGGKLVIVDWNKQGAPLGPPVDERVNIERLKESAYSLGFNKTKNFEPGPYHFGLIFRK